MKYLKSYKIFESITDYRTICHYILEKISEYDVSTDIKVHTNTYTLNVNGREFLLTCDLCYDKLGPEVPYYKYHVIYEDQIIYDGDDSENGILTDLRQALYRIYMNTDLFINVIIFMCKVNNKSEVIERMEEFEVIKNHQIDYISLNNLFDFYEAYFDIYEFKFNWKKIK